VTIMGACDLLSWNPMNQYAEWKSCWISFRADTFPQ
jgi:hypothetical protein